MAVKKKTTRKPRARTRRPKLLYRSERNRILGGVAGGFGEFFQIDPTLVRLVFIILLLTGGFGVVLYFILWLIVPPESKPGSISGESISDSAEEMGRKAEEFAEKVQNLSDERDYRSLWGLVILVVGLLFLFNNFGLLPWGVWGGIWRLWPLILILIALSILRKK